MTDNLLRECRKYASYIRHIQTRLAQLSQDLEITDKWQYHFAIDFAELMVLAFPLSSSHHIQMMPEENEDEAFSREIAVLSFIFSHTEKKILTITKNLMILPPYVDEMRAELTLVNHHLIRVEELINILRGIRDRFFTAGGYADERVNRITKQFYQRNVVPSNADWSYLADYSKGSYKHYLALIVSSAYGGAPFLKQLIEQKKIMGWKSYFRQFFSKQRINQMNLGSAFDSAVISRRLSDYLPKITQLESRKKLEKLHPNRTDASACVILSVLNGILKEENSSVLLLSHSYAMQKAVEPIEITIDGKNKTISGIRDLDYFWLYYVHMYYKKHSIDDMLTAVNEMNKAMLEFLQAYDTVCKERPIFQKDVETITSRLLRVKEYMEYLGNVSLAAQTDSNLFRLLNGMAIGSKTIAEFQNGREMARRMFDILPNERMVKLLGTKQEELSKEILNIEELRPLIRHIR